MVTIRDGVEINNAYINNLAVYVHPSTSLLNEDGTPGNQSKNIHSHK